MLGALTVYRAQVGKPAEPDLQLITHAARLAGIAMERRYAAEALRASEARFRGLYESVMDGVYQVSPEGRVLAVNPAFVKMLGYSTAEEIYALPSAAALWWNPAERPAFLDELHRNGAVHNDRIAAAQARWHRRWWCSRARACCAMSRIGCSPSRARSPTSPSASALSR